MIKHSDIKFKFPVRRYDWVEIEYDEWDEEINSKPPTRVIRTFVVGWKRVDIESIGEWEENFERGRLIQDVKKKGFDSTKVWSGDDFYICDWKIDRFEKEYNKHINKLIRENKRLAEQELEDIIKKEEFLENIKLLENVEQTTKGNL